MACIIDRRTSAGAMACLFVCAMAALAPTGARAADTDIVINEIMYHPDTDCEMEEFIELVNKSLTDTVDLSGWEFTDGTSYTFPAGTFLGPNEYLAVCREVVGFNSYYGTPPIRLYGPYNGKLSNDGEPLELSNAVGTVIDRVRYNDKRPWPISPDGAGPSLELLHPSDNNSSAAAWRAAIFNTFTTTWTRHEVVGVPSSTTVYFYLDNNGSCLIDDIELRATTNPVTNHIVNGGFETAAPLGWTATGNHAGSVRVTSDAHTGAACLQVNATGAGGYASGQVFQAATPMTLNGPSYTLSFWVKGLQPGIVLRIGLRSGAGGTWAPTNNQDIGSPPGAGGYSYDAGTDTYRVVGGGNDIWGSSDQFHYVYATMDGDGSLEATVSRISNPNGDGWAKGGIMIRETTAANSRYAYCLLSWASGVDFQYRTATGGGAGNVGPLSGGGPYRLRLKREGNNFTGEADMGTGMQGIGTMSISMNASVLIGFAVTSHDQSFPRTGVATYDFGQPSTSLQVDFYTDVVVPNFLATPGGQNSRFTTNQPPYIRNVDTWPDQPTSADPIEVHAKITDTDGITSAVLRYQLVFPGNYIRLGDPAYQTNWTEIPMSVPSTPSVYVASIPAQLNRTLVRYRISAQDGAGKVETVPYSDDSEPNYARFVYDRVPSYTAAHLPGVTTPKTFTVMEKVPVIHLIAHPADVNEAQTVSLGVVERREFKWRGTLFFNGRVYDHIRFRMRGGTWRYRYNKRMWKFRFNRGHRMDFLRNDGTLYEEELRTLNLLAANQPPGNVPSWVEDARGDGSQRGEEGFIDRTSYWLWRQVGGIAPECTWVHFRVVDNASETGFNQYSGDFFGLYVAVQGMDERMLRMSGRPAGNFYKIDSFNQQPGQPPWDVEAVDCALPPPQDDIREFRREFYPLSPTYPTPDQTWWETNFNLESYYSVRSIIECVHHGDLYDTTSWDGMPSGKNYYYYHNPETLKWEFAAWDVDLCFGTDHGGGSSPFRDRVVHNAAFPAFQVDYRNRMREIVQLLFCPEVLFPVWDDWYDMLKEIAEADMYRWDWAPYTASSDSWTTQGGLYEPLDVRLGDLKYWVAQRNQYLTRPRTRGWWLETAGGWPLQSSYDPDIPSTPTLVTPTTGTAFTMHQDIDLASSAFSDPNGNAHTASKWIATRVGRIELNPDWTSGITNVQLLSMTIPRRTLEPGDYHVRVRHMDSTGRWSWWSPAAMITVTGPALEIVSWPKY